ncbi:hypothetical protein [Thiomonas intermedia]|uniref:hypothetical protein n=1 Tax=Thiomonas intermedia TaxID=926 RepID=UPI0009A4C84A|nr:hypothetical protein [Thiomonas intermedia]
MLPLARPSFAPLRRLSSLIWLVVACLALQPLAWAQQAQVQAVSLPYCATPAITPSTAGASKAANHAPIHPPYVLLLLPSQACSGDHAPTGLLPHIAASASTPTGLRYAQSTALAWAPRSPERFLRPWSHAPPRHT